MASRLYPDQHLIPNTFLASPNGHSKLYIQDDGNLVLYRSDGSVPWASGTSSSNVKHLYMQADGNLVIYAGNGHIWASGTAGNPGAWLNLQDDGNLVIYSKGEDGRPLWFTGTANLLPTGDELYLEVLEAQHTAPTNDKLLKKAYVDGGDQYFRDLATIRYEVNSFLTALNADDPSTFKKIGKNYTIGLDVKTTKEERVINGKLYTGTTHATVSVDFDVSAGETVRVTFLSVKIATSTVAAVAALGGFGLGVAAFFLNRVVTASAAAASQAAAAATVAATKGMRIAGVALKVAKIGGGLLALVGAVCAAVSAVLYILDASSQNISLGIRIINLTDYRVQWSFADLGWANCIAATLASNKEIKEKDIVGEIPPIDNAKAAYSYADASMVNKNKLAGMAFSMKFDLLEASKTTTEHSCSVAFDLPIEARFNNCVYGEFGTVTDYNAFFHKMRGKYQYLKQEVANSPTSPTVVMDLIYDYLSGDHPKSVGDDKKGRNYNCLVVFRKPDTTIG